MNADRLPVQVVFQGEPFDREAALHTLRHLAMRAGWQLRPRASHRLLYAVAEDPAAVTAQEGTVVILSSPAVRAHLEQSRDPFPLRRTPDGDWLPFPHPRAESHLPPGWIAADVVAGAWAALNLWFECRTRSPAHDGWIRWGEDWMARAGLPDAQPLADRWLARIAAAAARVGWSRTLWQQKGGFLGGTHTLVLTHDVDYLPSPRNRGLPRLARALVRQLMARRRPLDAARIAVAAARALPRRLPYFALPRIAAEEEARGARSSFQVTVARRHRVDPPYHFRSPPIAGALRELHAAGWEICLHGSYTASRTPGMLAQERAALEEMLGAPVRGHRQHYLNFHPAQLWAEVEAAGLKYDLSVGYNDRSGPRAGTVFPYRPWDVLRRRPCALWEIPFVLMDTTLATTYRFSGRQAWEHARQVLEASRGCVAVIWHQEQLGGLLDPGFETVYYRLLDWARANGFRLTTGGALLAELDAAWRETLDG